MNGRGAKAEQKREIKRKWGVEEKGERKSKGEERDRRKTVSRKEGLRK